MRGTLIFSLILAIIAVIFALANPQEMDVNLVVTQIQGSTALVLILTLVLGVIIGILATLPSMYRERKKRKAVDAGDEPGDIGTKTKPKRSGSFFGSGKKETTKEEPSGTTRTSSASTPSSTSNPTGTPLGREGDDTTDKPEQSSK